MNTGCKWEEGLQATAFVDSDHPIVQEYAKTHTIGATTPVEQAVQLYYAVRDGFKYNPFVVSFQEEEMKASHIIAHKQSGYCGEKAVVLAAAARALGIPSRLAYGTVINHIGTGKVEAVLRTNKLACHGYTELYLNEKWIKATPAFNKELCAKFNVAPLEFDGINDAVFQEYDYNGGKYMEYVEYYGEFFDLPVQLMRDKFNSHYPHLSDFVIDDRFRLDLVAAA